MDQISKAEPLSVSSARCKNCAKKKSKCEVVHTYLPTKLLNTELLNNPRCNEGSVGRWTHHTLRPER
jgi:hypothetical protein